MNSTQSFIDGILECASFTSQDKNFQFYRGKNKKQFHLESCYHQELISNIADHVLADISNGEQDDDEFCLKRVFNSPHKMMLDIDASHTEQVKNPVGYFVETARRIGKLAESSIYKVFTRKEYYDDQHKRWKYGAHIIYYDTIISPSAGHYEVIVNDDIIKKILDAFTSDGFDVDIDKCAFNTSGVGLIGSRKAGSHQYMEILVSAEDNVFASVCDIDNISKTKIYKNPRKEDLISQIDLLFPDEGCHQWIVENNKPVQENTETTTPSCNNQLLEQLIDIISPQYFHKYDDWIRIGAAIKNAGGTVEMFDKMSKRGDGYRNFSDCKYKWDSFQRDSGVKTTIGSIKYYAKLSDPIAYITLIQNSKVTNLVDWIIYHQEDNSICKWIMNQKSGKIYDIVNTLFTLCPKSKGRTSLFATWYRFNGVYYKQIDEQDLKNDLFDEITRLLTEEICDTQKAVNEQTDKDKKSNLEEYLKRARKLYSTCNTSRFQNSVLIVLQNNLMVKYEDFIVQFNDKKGHVVFENCVYNAIDKKVITNDPNMKNTLSTGLVYNPTPSEENIKHFNEKIMNTMFPDIRVRNFMYLLLAKYLCSDRLQYFYIFTGVGSNGKSLLMNFIKNLTGEYYHNVQQTFLTQASNKGAADSDLRNCLHKRVFSVNEPDAKGRISADIIKTITGNDLVTARELYQEPIKFEVFAKPIIICNNVPMFTEFSAALERRFVNIQFESRFLSEEKYKIANDNDEPCVYLIDESVEKMIKNKDYLSDIASYLLQEYYTESNVLEIPDPCNRAAKEIIESQDIYKEFIDTCLGIYEGNNDTKLSEVYIVYKRFIDKYYPGVKPDGFRRGFCSGLRRNGLKFSNTSDSILMNYKITKHLNE